MSKPLPPGDPSWPCPSCAWPVNDEITADTPACPHGWSSYEGMSLADIKADFASLDDVFSIVPTTEEDPEP